MPRRKPISITDKKGRVEGGNTRRMYKVSYVKALERKALVQQKEIEFMRALQKFVGKYLTNEQNDAMLDYSTKKLTELGMVPIQRG